jgi:hypothetical protein
MKTALLIGMFLAIIAEFIFFSKSQRELAEAQTRAVQCEQTAKLADRVILTCLSQQTIVKWELQALGSLVRNERGCQ